MMYRYVIEHLDKNGKYVGMTYSADEYTRKEIAMSAGSQRHPDIIPAQIGVACHEVINIDISEKERNIIQWLLLAMPGSEVVGLQNLVYFVSGICLCTNGMSMHAFKIYGSSVHGIKDGAYYISINTKSPTAFFITLAISPQSIQDVDYLLNESITGVGFIVDNDYVAQKNGTAKMVFTCVVDAERMTNALKMPSEGFLSIAATSNGVFIVDGKNNTGAFLTYSINRGGSYSYPLDKTIGDLLCAQWL